jgi:hypothetical protein
MGERGLWRSHRWLTEVRAEFSVEGLAAAIERCRLPFGKVTSHAR